MASANYQLDFERPLYQLEEKIAEIKGKIEAMEAETQEEKKLRWEFLLAAVPGLLALLTGL